MLHWQVHYHHILSSTQSFIKSQINTIPEGQVIVAQRQEMGRGRKGDPWDSQRGGLYASFILRPNQLLNELPLVLLRSIHCVLEEVSSLPLVVKWPNDILYQEKKLSGLLIDAQMTGNQADYYICGFGININQDHFPADLKACSLLQITHQQFSIAVVLSKVLIAFQNYYHQYLLDAISFCQQSVSLLPWLEYNETIEKWKV